MLHHHTEVAQRRPLAAAAAGLLLLTAACATAPPRRPPELPVEVPQTWTAGDAEERAETPPDAWWRTLGDDRLPALVEEALRENRDLSAAAARMEAAAAQARVAGADALPRVDGSER